MIEIIDDDMNSLIARYDSRYLKPGENNDYWFTMLKKITEFSMYLV